MTRQGRPALAGLAPRPARWVRAILLGALLLGVATAEDDGARPASEPESVLLAGVVSDPGGEATRVLGQAVAAYASDDPATAWERLVTLAERHPRDLVPVSLFGGAVPGRVDGALRWPARRVANHALATLPEPWRERLEERWAPATHALWARVQRGDDLALEVLAAAYGATTAGSRALLLLGERALERGAAAAGARALAQWLELNPQAAPSARAAVVLRLADALGDLGDAGAVAALGVAHQDLRGVPVRAGGRTTDLAERIATWRARARPPAPAPPPPPVEPWRQPLEVLWSRSIEDPLALHEGTALDDAVRGSLLGVRAGAWGEGRTLVLHEGHVVRCLDVVTGVESWRFPDVPRPAMHDPRERYTSHDLPLRTVTAVGGRLLVVLGEPAANGRYTFLEQEFEAQERGIEARTRLVCLDAATGALRWSTGTAEDSHPILGHRATGCASPPLVVGDDVYCLFARRLGATSFFAARLDLATGAPRWVSALASGSSGRSDDRSELRNRFAGQYVQSVPWGARPSLAGDELCVVPHAGFAAGLAAAGGTVRWLRALPRYALDVSEPATGGHNVRNVPLAWGDAWLLAPMDSPRLLCLERSTGDLRWQRGGRTPADPPGWRDLLGIVPDGEGRPRMRLSGWAPVLMDPADGSLTGPAHAQDWDLEDGDPAGAALDLGDCVARAAAGSLQVQAWRAPRGEQPEGLTRLPLEGEGVPSGGDLYRVGDLLVVVGRDRVAALAPKEALRGPGARLAAPGGRVSPETDAADAAAELGQRAVLEGAPALLAEAIVRARDVVPAPRQEALWARLAEELDRLIDPLDTLEGDPWSAGPADGAALLACVPLAQGLPPAWRGRALQRLARLLYAAVGDEPATRLLLAWLGAADDTLVPLLGREGEDAVSLRGDLIAGALLREHADRPAVRAILEAREPEAIERLRAARAQGEGALREALRRVAGTRAAAWGRRQLLRSLEREGRALDAAAVAADLRLDPPWLDAFRRDAQRLEEVALLQMTEARHLATAWEGLRARTLAADLARWSPGGLEDEQGRTVSALEGELRRAFGWYPQRRAVPQPLDVWQDEPVPDRDEVRSLQWLGLTGPGACAHPDLALGVRGLTPEVWSLPAGRRLARLPGDDEGWFGGSLMGVDPWLPGGGILVTSIVAGEPADLGGVRAGDWVRRWNGEAVEDLPAFMNLVASSRPDTTIAVEVVRNGRAVLERFRAGRRPVGHGRMLDYGPLWADADGTVLLPGRTGLSRLDLRAGTRTSLWVWRERGIVRRVRVATGCAWITVQRGPFPDLVVALDTATGRERWRREVPGAIAWVEPVGSALWIQTEGPARAVVLDAATGRPRGTWRCFDMRRHEFRKTWVDPSPAAVAAGRGFLVTGVPDLHAFHVVNTSTAATEYSEAWSGGGSAGYDGYVNPQVEAGAYVAVLRAPGLRLFFPDPLGGAPRHLLDVDGNLLMSNQSHYGTVDSDTRITVRGSTLTMVRVPSRGRRNVSAAVFGVGYEALGDRATTTGASPGAAFYMRTSQIWMSGNALPTRYVIDVNATFEGVLVAAAQLADDHKGETWWVSAMDEDDVDENRHARLLEADMHDARRYAPVRSGRMLLVPTDRGAHVFPVRTYDD